MGVLESLCRVNILGTSCYVHRLVAFAFPGPPPTFETWQVHHRDGHMANNRLENLEDVTPRQNVLESYAKPRRTEADLRGL